MSNIILSVIIPSYKDPLLIKTIGSLLANSELGDRLEIIISLDGYWPSFELVQDPRVRYIHLGRNRGMRGAINAAIAVARGEYILRTDEHCMFAQGYDKVLTGHCRPNWIVTPRRYFLDPVKWEVMDIPPVDYEKLVIQKVNDKVRKFAGRPWKSRTTDPVHARKTIDQTMAMQGSAWVVPHKWWDDVIGELQTEGYGPLYGDSHEIVFKTWKAGGKLVVNKGTWFAHKHRSFRRTHNDGTKENPANKEAGWAYSLSIWEDYYQNKIRKVWKI